jgi:hypothetical protein
MKTRQLSKFRKWYKERSAYRGLLCHFYFKQSKSKVYDKADYAYFNLLNRSKEWIVKGTEGHGRTSERGGKSNIPLLNCYEIDETFYNALKQLDEEQIDNVEIGIILNRRRLENSSDIKAVDPVSTDYPENPLKLIECHRYDNPYHRKGVLYPFNYCNVIRAVIRPSILKIPIARIPANVIEGFLIKRGETSIIRELLEEKRMGNTEIFPILPNG